MRLTRVVKAVAVLAVAGLSAACGSLPTSGTPHAFPIEVPTRDPIGQYGSGPQEGSSPEVLVEDFLRACAAGAFDDYSTAKLYLLPETADSWIPTSQVVVFPTDQSPSVNIPKEEDGKATATITVPTIGTVDRDGVLNELADIGTTTLSFDLELDSSGQWRISKLEDGLILSQNSFTTGFGQYNLYFASVAGDALVADPRWMPRLRVSSHLVNGILEGPSQQIRDAVIGDLGSGLSLSTSGVDVRDRAALVDLEGKFEGDSEARRLLMWQIGQTLRQAPNVQTSLVTINSVDLDPQDVPQEPAYMLDRIAAISEGAIVVGGMKAFGAEASAEQIGEGAAFPSVGPLEDSPIAWVDSVQGAVYVAEIGEEPKVFTIPNPSDPSVDRHGNVWVLGGESKSDLYVISPEGEPALLEPPVPDVSLSKVAISPDGARALFVGSGVDGGAIWLGTVVSDENLSFRVTSVVALDRFEGNVLDVSWTSAANFVALLASEEEGGETTIKTVPVGGWSSSYTAPADSVWISGGTAGLGVIVQRADQVAFLRSGVAWRDLGGGLKYIATPG